MVDISLGLDLTINERDTVMKAFSNTTDFQHSLNQSMGYIRDTPLWIDFEVKTPYSDRNAEVQLGIWKASMLSKMQVHGWDTSIPMPGIIVTGHEWVLYLGFERKGDLVILSFSLHNVTIFS